MPEAGGPKQLANVHMGKTTLKQNYANFMPTTPIVSPLNMIEIPTNRFFLLFFDEENAKKENIIAKIATHLKHFGEIWEIQPKGQEIGHMFFFINMTFRNPENNLHAGFKLSFTCESGLSSQHKSPHSKKKMFF